MADDTKIEMDDSLDKDELTPIDIPLESGNNLSDTDNRQEEFMKKGKKFPIKKILIGVISLLVLLIVVGTILYFLDFFKKEEPEMVVQPVATEIVKEAPPVKEEEYKFDMKDINSKKLNEELSFLTNKNLNQDKIDELEKLENEKKLIEEQKRKEEEALKMQEEAVLKEKEALEAKRLALENEKAELEALKEEALKMKQELLEKQTSNENNSDNTEEKSKEEPTQEKQIKEDSIATSTQNDVEDSFLKFINVAKIKGVLYKKYLDKVTAINPNLTLCRDDKNRIDLFYGPFENENERKELLDKLLANKFEQAYAVEFTKEEFDKRCNY